MMNWTIFSTVIGAAVVIAGALIKIYADKNIQHVLDDHTRRIIILEESRKPLTEKVETIENKIEEVLKILMKLKIGK